MYTKIGEAIAHVERRLLGAAPSTPAMIASPARCTHALGGKDLVRFRTAAPPGRSTAGGLLHACRLQP